MFKTEVHRPYKVKACKAHDTIWFEATDQNGDDRGGELAVFLTLDQAIQIRDEFNAMDLPDKQEEDADANH